MKIFLSSTPEGLETVAPQVTVEAEYGSTVVGGSLLTLAHHGERAANPCPCLFDGQVPAGIETVGISHVDLDTLGGVARVCPDGAFLFGTPDKDSFWAVAAQIDIAGPHRLNEALAVAGHRRDYVRARLHAWWAWSQANRGPRATAEAVDVTQYVEECLRVLRVILKQIPFIGCEEHRALLAAGEAWAAAQSHLNAASWLTSVRHQGYTVAIRQGAAFTNHLYTAPSGEVCDLVLSLNTVTGAITLSREGDGVKVNCCEVMQQLYGPLAGGHAAIAGSPRGETKTQEDLDSAVAALVGAAPDVCCACGTDNAGFPWPDYGCQRCGAR